MSTQVAIRTAEGKEAGSVELPSNLFDVQTNVPLIHQVVVAQLAAARQGTHKTKGRGEVSGSGRKPFKQKGTGRSRQGSIRAPEHTGGGIVHGPVPRDYSQRTPKKMIAAALLGSLSDRARGGRLHVVESLVVGDAPKTRTALELLDGLGVAKNILVVLDASEETAFLSVRNLQEVHVLTWNQLNAYDVLVSDDVVFSKAAYDAFVKAKSASASTPRARAAVADTEDVVDTETETAAEAESASATVVGVAAVPAAADEAATKDAAAIDGAEADEATDDDAAEADSTDFGPDSAAPNADGSAPEGFDIKGNADSMLFHRPGSRSYAATIAEVWFRTAEAAEAQGFTEAGKKAKKAEEEQS